MTEISGLETRIKYLEEEIAHLKGIVHVILEELENDSIENSARRIKELLEHRNDIPR